MLRHKYTIILCVTVLVFLLWFALAWYYYMYLFLFWFVFTIWGSFDIRLNYFTKAYCGAKANFNKEIAITFDDGPHEMTEKILDLLLKYNVNATFFCIGSQIEQKPKVFQRIIAEGHTIGNHSYSHSNLIGFFSTQKMEKEIEMTNNAIASFLGKRPRLYRPPFGVTNPNIARALNHLKMDVVGWNIRSLDTVIKNEDKVFQRVKNKLVPGGIVLLHDTSEKAVVVLERLLLFLQSEKYNIVTVDKLLNIEPYET